ncbi:MAG: TRAP transporter small permease subunit [Treponema sp.]|jgi:TRAP-type C4-dicarboxylate transport system permease small subunit|nr:TRAP transporter small permease subunit [Treponema sp.]
MTRFLSVLVTIAMIMILGVTFVQVAVRFVFHVPIGGWDEVPTYMMLLGTWLTAAVNVKKKDHISLDLYVLFIKNEKIRKIIQLLVCVITIAVFFIFGVLLSEFVQYNFFKKATTPGLSVPYWIILGIILFSVILMVIYYVIQLAANIKEMLKWK